MQPFSRCFSAVFVIETMKGEIFGGFANDNWIPNTRSSNNKFFGRGGFLFKVGEGDDGEDPNVMCYHWTGADSYCQLIDFDSKSIAMGGGGEGGFGFRVGDDFSIVTSGESVTFKNDILCEGGFGEVLDVECWGFST